MVACGGSIPPPRSKKTNKKGLKVLEVFCYHEGTCLPDYLQNHHNGDRELLIGITPCGQSENLAIQNILREIDQSDKIPEGLTTEEIACVVSEAVKGVDFRYIDSNGNRASPLAWVNDDGENESMVWFVLYWHEV